MSENPSPTPDDDPFTPPSYGPPIRPPAPFGPSVPLPGHPAASVPPPGYPAASVPPAGYALPPQYYAGPEDPLVSGNIGGWWNRSDVDPKSMGKPGYFALPPVQDIKLPRPGH